MVGVEISKLSQGIGVVIFCCMLILAPVSFAQETPQNVENAQTEQASEPARFTFVLPPEFQTDLPQEKVQIGEMKKRKQRRSSSSSNRRRNSGSIGAFGGVIQIMFYGILALAVLYILYLIFNSMAAIKRSNVKKDTIEEIPEVPDYTPDAETAKEVLDDAEKLASMGKFTEAVHVILFRSIADIDKKRPHYVKRSFTSREIADLSILSPNARKVFSQIARLVENSFFGGRSLVEADYQSSVTAYQALVSENRPQTSVARKTRDRR